jgi:O2-independent ubiquinone biosynthesis protein UbiV
MIQLALGPVQYYWPRATLLAFYDEVARSPVDIVCLGEVVCSRRHEMRLPDWLDLAAQLRDAGKQVVLSTQVLLESVSDVGAMQRVAANAQYLVEANDMGAVRALAAAKLPFVAGPHLNLFNPDALAWMAQLGATRWVPPLEMSREDVRAMQSARPHGVATELFAFGRLPLAYSARCFTARHHDLPKDDCRFRCMDDPDGLLLSTREGEPFLVLNGIQTQSAAVHSLLADFGDLQSLGIDVLRVSPMSRATCEVLALFDAVRRGRQSAREADERLRELLPARECNGYWHGRPGMEAVAAKEAA